MNAKLKFGIHQLAVKVHLGECSLNYIGRYNTKWCAGSDLITERPFLHTRSVIRLEAAPSSAVHTISTNPTGSSLECNIAPPAMAEGKWRERKRPR